LDYTVQLVLPSIPTATGAFTPLQTILPTRKSRACATGGSRSFDTDLAPMFQADALALETMLSYLPRPGRVGMVPRSPGAGKRVPGNASWYMLP
jgi:hypothetical protein